MREAANMCKKLNIPFPEVNIPSEEQEKPKDFYVFKGQNAPTVIHIPLFNVANCGGKLRSSSCIKQPSVYICMFQCFAISSDEVEAWTNKYHTFQDPYSAEMITDLMEVAGKNISNNMEKLKEQIAAVIG